MSTALSLLFAIIGMAYGACVVVTVARDQSTHHITCEAACAIQKSRSDER